LIYGANGYTGALTARLAAERGLRPILAGRSRDKVEAVARPLGLETRVYALDDAAAADAALREVAVVLHCAGPFSRTAQPMAGACLRTGAHYLDITGEVAVFEALAARDAEAKAAGVMLMPGAGFDVVPSDCLAAHLKRRLPTASQLVLAFRGVGARMSRGTATTMVENLHRGGLVRRDGILTPIPTGSRTRKVDFGRGPVQCMAIPWGDVSTAWYSTRIPDIEVYTAAPAVLRTTALVSRYMAPVLASGPVQRLLKGLIQRQPEGPSDEERAKGFSLLWGEVQDPQGRRAATRMRTPEGYTLTALASLRIVQKVLEGNAPAGFQTPSMAYGPDLVLEVEGVERVDLD
jgi:short subunit dehydrogenase-like uncharacterized protein